jgi:hypothetical protein
MNFSRQSGRGAILLVLTFVCTACGSNGGPTLHSVMGKVTFNGQAPEGATVTLIPNAADSTMRPSAVVGSDGTFTLQTHPHGQGAPEGAYTAIVMWMPENARELANAKNKLPERYADPTTSGLKCAVKPGSNQLEPFVLTGEAPKAGKK